MAPGQNHKLIKLIYQLLGAAALIIQGLSFRAPDSALNGIFMHAAENIVHGSANIENMEAV